MSAAVIRARGVHKRYGSVEALRGADLEVEHGEIFCLLGPNGAGKTTLLEILEGYRSSDRGAVEVLGQDPAGAGGDWRARIGIVAQQGEFEPELTVREQVARFAGYFPRPLDVGEVLGLVGLGGKEAARCNKLSGGEHRRLDIAVGLVGDPQLLFLDEPTTGLDPTARRATWALVEQLRERGTSILLTTHYMEEAQALADRIAMIVAGRVSAQGTAAEMAGRSRRGVRIRFRLEREAWAAAPGSLRAPARQVDELVEVSGVDEVAYLREAIAWSESIGRPLRELEVHRPSIGDVYLELAGEGKGNGAEPVAQGVAR